MGPRSPLVKRTRHFLEQAIPGLHTEQSDPQAQITAEFMALSPEARKMLDALAGGNQLDLNGLAAAAEVDQERAQGLVTELSAGDWLKTGGPDSGGLYRLGEHAAHLHAELAAPPDEYQELRGQVIHRVYHYTRYRVVAILLAYVVQVLMARHMGVHDYGFYSLVSSTGSLLSHFIPLGMATTVVRYLPSYMKEGDWNLFRGLINRSYHITLLSSAVVMVVGGGLVLAWNLDPNEKITFLLGLLLGPLMALTDLVSCQLEGEKRFDSAYFLDIFLAPVLLLIIISALALTLHSFGHLAAILAVTGVQAVMLVIMLVAFLRTQPAQAKGPEPHYRTKKWFKVALPVLIMTGFMVIVYRADLFVVGMFLGRHEAGIYAAVLTIAGFLAFFLKAVDSATNPEIAPCFKAGHLVTLQRLSRLIAQISFWPTLALSLAFAIFGKQLLDLFGDGFRPGFLPLVILCLSWVIKGASGAPGYLLLMTGNQMKLVINFSFMVALDLVLLVVLTLWLGLPGAAVASTLSILVSRVALVVVAQKATGIHTSILAGIFGGQVQDRPPLAKD